MPGLRLPTIQELAAAQQAQQDAPQEDWGLTMAGRMAHMPPPTAATGAGGGSGGKIERSPIADFARSLFVARPEDAARRAAYAQANAQMLGLGQEGGAPPAAPQNPQDPLPAINLPNVPSNAPNGELQAQMIQSYMGRMPGKTQIGAPRLGMTSYQEPDVQAQLQKPEVQAMMAPSAGDIQFSPDAFLQAPEGEAGLENFMFREMAVLGSRTPQAVQSGWLQIQQAKRQRIGDRADFLSGLVKQRYLMDLQRRNEGDRLKMEDGWKAMDRVSQIRAQQAQLDLQTRIANANLLEQYKDRFTKQQLAELQAKLGAGPMEVRRAEKLSLAASSARKRVNTLQSATELINVLKEMNDEGTPLTSWGAISKLANKIMSIPGSEKAARLRMKFAKVNQQAIFAATEYVGSKGVDTSKELEFYKAAQPKEGDPFNVSAEWFNQVMSESVSELSGTYRYMNDLAPGRGTELQDDLNQVMKAMQVTQQVGTAQAELSGGRPGVVNYEGGGL